ncbi:MAG TPA: tyrosine-type recombinase/integrase [Polyangiaceae bacterium]
MAKRDSAPSGETRREFLFSKDGAFPRYIDSHKRPLKLVQQKLGLRLLSHHKLGRHSVASQAVTGGESMKAVQAQLGHRSEQSTHQYAHLGSGAQRRLVEALEPARAPHEPAPKKSHGILASSASKSHFDDGRTLH